MNSPGLTKHIIAKKNKERGLSEDGVTCWTDGKHLTEAMVIDLYKNWVASIINKTTCLIPDRIRVGMRADLEQEANIALLLRWRLYQQEEIEFPFIPYSWIRIRGAVVDGFRDKHYKYIISHRVKLISRDDDGVFLPGSEGSYCENHDDNIDLVRAVETLEPWEQNLLNLLYMQDETLKFIGSLADVTESRVCQVHTQIIGKLRKVMAA